MVLVSCPHVVSVAWHTLPFPASASVLAPRTASFFVILQDTASVWPPPAELPQTLGAGAADSSLRLRGCVAFLLVLLHTGCTVFSLLSFFLVPCEPLKDRYCLGVPELLPCS